MDDQQTQRGTGVESLARTLFTDDDATELNAVADVKDGRMECPGLQGDDKYVKIKNGIAIDSGAAAMVMPEDWIPSVPKQPSPGSVRGQNFTGATWRTANHTGQKRLDFDTMSGQPRRATFQCADVTKTLGSVTGFADSAGPGKETFIIFSC